MANIFEQVKALIARLAPAPICDDCIAERLEPLTAEHASRIAHELAGIAEFERRKDTCSMCGALKVATAQKPR